MFALSLLAAVNLNNHLVHRYGVKNFWFDASEPENLKDFGGQGGGKDGPALETPLGQPQGALYSAGSNQQVGMMYPYWHAKMAYRMQDMEAFLGRVGGNLVPSTHACVRACI